MISYEDAVKAFNAFVLAHRGGCTVEELLEDAEDYFAVLDYHGPIPVGDAVIFVNKKTGKVWTDGMVFVLDKVFAMESARPQ